MRTLAVAHVTCAAALVVLASAAGCGGVAPPGVATVPVSDPGPPGVAVLSAEGSAIALRRSVVADQYFWLRAKVLEGEAPKPFEEALAAMQELRSGLGTDAEAWEDLEVPLGEVTRATELAAAYDALAEKKSVGSRVVPLRADAMRLAKAMAASEDAFRRGPYREHADAIRLAAEELSTHLAPKEDAILRAIEADMAVPAAGRSMVITLVSDAPYQGTFASDQPGRVSATFVRIRGLSGLPLIETVLHEVLHAFDEMNVREKTTAMNALRAELAKRGLDETDSNVEMAVNTMTLAEAASLVQRFVDPKHEPLGVRGFYTLFPPAPAIVAAWSKHVQGEPLATTTSAMAAAVTAP